MDNKTYQRLVREADEYNEKYVADVVTPLYELFKFKPIRCNEKSRQILGEDLVIRIRDEEDSIVRTVVDEKADISRQLNAAYRPNKNNPDKASTFCQEVERRNYGGYRQTGWFHPECRMKARNSHYMFIWLNFDKDKPDKTGKLVKINQIELCLVSHRKLVEMLNEDENFNYETSLDEYIAYLQDALAHGEYQEKDIHKLHNFKCKNMHVTYSSSLYEKPINIVVYKNALRQVADFGMAFEMEGSNRQEQAKTIRCTVFNKQYPRAIYNRDFLPVADFFALKKQTIALRKAS